MMFAGLILMIIGGIMGASLSGRGAKEVSGRYVAVTFLAIVVGFNLIFWTSDFLDLSTGEKVFGTIISPFVVLLGLAVGPGGHHR
ncbi:hypothetical protein M768_13855 [Cellulosimicrobium cellulans F16]|uniref:Uncharacterized protein n=1 Tax=Cellulosimicrobium cellulans F16 TaxID=1350482 RepID=A0A0M0F5D5_CELCE|nr:hypothetical protein [Cellulosimicrobium cellulans]KON72587.1 hypothetical protein M768_13855 [Cellulosimicrobium cellulans F16]